MLLTIPLSLKLSPIIIETNITRNAKSIGATQERTIFNLRLRHSSLI